MIVYNKSGDVLFDINEANEIARGGEGKIIDYNNKIVLKLYLPNIKPITEQKFKELKTLNSPYFVKPEELFYDKYSKILGFSMKKISSNFFPLISIFNKNFCLRESITETIKFTIFHKLIDALVIAHNSGIIIGDLNPYNILVNDLGELFFIDVDSYETKSCKHSGILLDDIRDFLYNGIVTTNSDYFALAVIIFNIFTYVHPFKGINKSFPKLEDRMVYKKSILIQDPLTIIPKCYEELKNNNFKEQFNRIFNGGERFLLSLINNPTNTQHIKKEEVVIKTNELIIHNIKNLEIIDSFASKTKLVLLGAPINNKSTAYVYDVSLKGTTTFMLNFTNINKSDKIFVFENDIFILKNNNKEIGLYDAISGKLILNFNHSSNILKTNLYNNILVVLIEDTLYKVDLKTAKINIIYEVLKVHGSKYKKINGFFQHVSGNTVLFYEKQGLNTLVYKDNLKDCIQKENILLIETINNEKINYKFLVLKSLKVIEFNTSLITLKDFDIVNENLLIFPEDNYLSFININTMESIIKYNCNIILETSKIHATLAGIIIVNENNVYLINRK